MPDDPLCPVCNRTMNNHSDRELIDCSLVFCNVAK